LRPACRVIIIIQMIIRQLHDWDLSITQARQIQHELAGQVIRYNDRAIRFKTIAGVDISGTDSDNNATAAVVVLSYPYNNILEVATFRGIPPFPYVSGFLSFREIPLIIKIFQTLSNIPDIILVDGQGIAHPRRFGLASHLGLILDIPTIGCAKSRLCGSHDAPDNTAGAYSELVDKNEIIGAVVRTKTNVRPLYISIGHKIDLQSAVNCVLECCRGYRLPEATRLAHLAAGGKLPARYK
jgi:deoxyribonuclease V